MRRLTADREAAEAIIRSANFETLETLQAEHRREGELLRQALSTEAEQLAKF